VVLVREGDDQLEAFGAGDADPAVNWLADKGRPVSLVAPVTWRDALGRRVGPTEQAAIETWTIDPFDLTMATMFEGPEFESAASSRHLSQPSLESTVTRRIVPIRALSVGDAAGFAGAAPPWALRGWGSFSTLIAFGAGFGVPHGDTFAALAWIFDQSGGFDSIGVFTLPRYRRLGLARAAATALIGHISRRRRKIPLWSSPPDNEASAGLARSLGFTVQATEALIRWPPRSQPTVLAWPSK
jgi:hypothetical protein